MLFTNIRTIISTVALLVTTTHASNTVKFINHCPYPAWFWVVGPEGSNLCVNSSPPTHYLFPLPLPLMTKHLTPTSFGADPSATMVPPSGGSIIHPMHNTEALGGGMSLKLRDLPHYTVAPAGIMQVEYHLEPSRHSFWYDLSAIDCLAGADPRDPRFCPFVDGGLKLHVAASGCPQARCVDGTCVNTYMHEGSWLDEPSFDCGAGRDLLVEMCTESEGRRSLCDQVEGVAPVISPSLEVSPDGACGGETGFTCKGSPWGECCSQYGICGSSPRSCGERCQSSHGLCHGHRGRDLGVRKEAVPRQTLDVSPNGRCGADSGYVSCLHLWDQPLTRIQSHLREVDVRELLLEQQLLWEL